jgi:hypothetical protein
MTSGAAASLINLLGFITGLVLYVMLLWMVLTSGRPTADALDWIWALREYRAFGG